MPGGVTLVLFLAGPMVMIGYVASSLSRQWVVSSGDRSSPSTLVEVTTTLLAAGGAWAAIRYAAPGRTTFQNASAIGFLSSQVLTAWSSLALWTGVAAVLGHVAPASTRFRSGTSGIAGGFALLAVFLPITALAAAGAWFGSLALTRMVRPALAITYLAVVVVEWVLSVVNPPGPYGLVHGPETTLWVAVLAGVLTFRWAAGDIGVSSEAGQRPEDFPYH
ncbi:MAG: glycerol-3-phosphate acyltransferase [Acidimicrobiia bacterium]|nr:glycerol-3-phosphate acyltransferase [Acidimicrobiia bacterium]